MTMSMTIVSFVIPSRLLSRMPHFLETECSEQANVLAAMAMPMTAPFVCSAPAACNVATAKAIELTAVLPKTIKEKPNTHVARNLGSLKK